MAEVSRELRSPMFSRSALGFLSKTVPGLASKLHCVSKKVPTFKLSVTLSNVNRFVKFLHCWKAYEICYKLIRHYYLTLGMLLHYLGKLKMQIFCRYSAHIEENANKLHFYRLYLLNNPQISIFSVFIIASFLQYWLQIKFSMSLLFYLFTSAINLWHWKFVTADVTAVFVNNQHGIQWQKQDFDKNT